MGANTQVWASRFHQWRTKRDSALSGIAYLPESAGADSAAFELFAELAWRSGPIDHASWFRAYAQRRYGGDDPHAKAAWEALRSTAYAMPDDGRSEPQDSLFTARPDLTAQRAARWSPGQMRYDPVAFGQALEELLAVDPSLRDSDAYRYDLVNVARQVLANSSRALLPKIKAAYDARDRAQFTALARTWMTRLDLLDKLLATDERFLFGRYLSDVDSWSANSAERAQLAYDARSILTVWGDRAGSEAGLRDYGNREWAGLVRDFYAMRWQRYFATLDGALDNGTSPEVIDWFSIEDAWAHQPNDQATYSTEPSGDPYTIAKLSKKSLPESSFNTMFWLKLGGFSRV